MKKVLLTIFFISTCIGNNAQVKFTEEIQKQIPGQGKLVLHQSQTITDLVNATITRTAPVSAKTENKASTSSLKKPQIEDSLLADTIRQHLTGQRIRMNGYRIQVYLGGNTRRGKNEAQAMKERVKGFFPELSVYAGFLSPHWICRAGDFRTVEEANEYLHKMRETGRFDEAIIVKSKINARE